MTMLTHLARALFAVPPAPDDDKMLAYLEAECRRTFDDLRMAYNAHFDRAIKVLTLLTGGAGAVAAYTLNQWPDLDAATRVALVCMTISWAMDAIYIATRVMRSRTLDAGADLMQMVANHQKGGMLTLRQSELNREHKRIQAFQAAVTQQTRGLRTATVVAAAAPLVAMALAWGVSVWG